MFILLTMQPMQNILNAVKTGFFSWFMLAVGLGLVFCVLLILKKLFKAQDK